MTFEATKSSLVFLFNLGNTHREIDSLYLIYNTIISNSDFMIYS